MPRCPGEFMARLLDVGAEVSRQLSGDRHPWMPGKYRIQLGLNRVRI